jgi:hypothetical protein
MIKIKRRFPNCFSGFEETEHCINSRKELEQINWVENIIKNKTFYSLAISKSTKLDIPHLLMSLNSYDAEYGGCKSWWVVGYIFGDSIDELDLPEYEKLIGGHKEGCPMGKFQHNICECGFKNNI